MSTITNITVSTDITLQTLDDLLLPRVSDESNEYTMDLSSATYITAPGGVILLLFLEFIKSKGKKISLILPRDERALKFLSNVRFIIHAERICDNIIPSSSLFDVNRPYPEPVSSYEMSKRKIFPVHFIPNGVHELEFGNWLSESIENSLVEDIARKATDKISELTGGRYKNLPRVYGELCNNVYQHSRSLGYVACQEITETDTKPVLRVGIGDLGIGFFQSLATVYTKDIAGFEQTKGPVWDEAKAIDIAFIPGVSSKRINKDDIRGIGLSTVLAVVKEAKGSLICRSGKTKLFLGYSRNQWRTLRKHCDHHFPGAQLEVNLH
jgi:hypothetical protein